MSFFVKHGVHLFRDFPFKGHEERCNIQAPPFTKIKGMNDGFLNELGLTEELEKGPVGVAIEVTHDYRLYDTGIMDLKYPCGMFLNHGVLAVGYDTDPSQMYIKLRNSWGADWGEKGFFRVEMNGPVFNGFCGITEEGARPVL
jgi:cathepsin H